MLRILRFLFNPIKCGMIVNVNYVLKIGMFLERQITFNVFIRFPKITAIFYYFRTYLRALRIDFFYERGHFYLSIKKHIYSYLQSEPLMHNTSVLIIEVMEIII